MIKPFNWCYPTFIYSKDHYLLESPFPIIAGISRQVFIENSRGEHIKKDRISFDLDRGEVYISKETLQELKFLEDPERCSKICTIHRKLFNDAKSHILVNNNGILHYDDSPNKFEMLSNDLDSPDLKSVEIYFSNYLKLIGHTFVAPLLEIPAPAVEKKFIRELM